MPTTWTTETYAANVWTPESYLPTAWTPDSYLPIVWTDETPVTTTWSALVPYTFGFGEGYFGDPTWGDYKGMAIHFRGFGDAKTTWTSI